MQMLNLWVYAQLIGSLLRQNDVFFMGTFYSNAYGDQYIFKSINWNLDIDLKLPYEKNYVVIY
jgi:drug/metabolite transporter superfamily protein YnfA